MKTRAEVRRAIALAPDAERHALAVPFAELASGFADAGELIQQYLFDPNAGAILATTDARAQWLSSPLFQVVGPGNYAFVDDVIPALIAAPILSRGGELSARAIANRFAPRADDAIALAISALPRERRAQTLAALTTDKDPDRQILATIQCGRVLAWTPSLIDDPVGARVLDALVELLAPASPKPLLDEVARALGPIARHSARVREAALARLDIAPPAPASFAGEIAAIGKPRRLPDQDRWMSQPARECAAAAAFILGACAPIDRDAFTAHRTLVLDRPDGDALFEPFLAGLVAAAHVPAASELCAQLLATGGEATATGFTLAAALPLDACAPVLFEGLDAELPDLRALACEALTAIGATDGDIDGALALRLADPSVEVSAAAALVLLARDRRDLLEQHAARDVQPVRRAIAQAALGQLDVPVIGELVRTTLASLDPDGEGPGASPLVRLTTNALLGSPDGVDMLASLLGGVPEAAAMFALAVIDEADIAVLAPPDPRSRLGAAVMRIATDADAGAELGTLALALLAHVSAGDTTLADVIADALDQTDGYAANLIAALGELRVATPRTGAVLATLLAPDQPIGARVMAAAICGRALPKEHASWAHVRELLSLGTIARAAAYAALRDRARH
ncbi:MAG: hypothetical protein QM831_41345 [Kofleriaceae bacterium]